MSVVTIYSEENFKGESYSFDNFTVNNCKMLFDNLTSIKVKENHYCFITIEARPHLIDMNPLPEKETIQFSCFIDNNSSLSMWSDVWNEYIDFSATVTVGTVGV